MKKCTLLLNVKTLSLYLSNFNCFSFCWSYLVGFGPVLGILLDVFGLLEIFLLFSLSLFVSGRLYEFNRSLSLLGNSWNVWLVHLLYHCSLLNGLLLHLMSSLEVSLVVRVHACSLLSFFIGFFLLALQGLAELIKCFQFLTGRTTEWDPLGG